MHVGHIRRIAGHAAQPLHAVAAHAQAHAQALAARVPVHGLQAAPMPGIAPVALPTPFAAPGAIDHPVVDAARAHHDAQLALDGIDWSRRDIVLWLPDTGTHAPDPAFATAAREAWGTTGSISVVDYEASSELARSMPTGLATLRLVLEAIRKHGGHHRVFLAGAGQGAWIIGEALADPALRGVVERATLFGQPATAAHDYADGHDAGVLEVDHPGDTSTTTHPVAATGAGHALAGVSNAIADGVGRLAGALLSGSAGMVAGAARTVLHATPKDAATDYAPEAPAAVEFLRWGKDGDPKQGDDSPRIDAGPDSVPTVRAAA